MIWKHLITPLLLCESVLGQSLLSVLEANGFTEFAQQLQGDPVLVAPGNNFIIYAPANTGSHYTTVKGRQSFNLKARNSFHAVDASGPSSPIPFRKRDVKTGGSAGVSLLTDPQFSNLGAGRAQIVIQKPSDAGLRPSVFSGLGEKVDVTGNDIPFEKGVIRPIDKPLTLPASVSSTLPQLGVGKFTELVSNSGLLSTLDSKASLTILAPVDAAFNNITKRTDDDLVRLIKSHVLVDFVAYSPLLRDGLIYTTLGGDKVKVTVQNDVIYIGGAKILSGDTITTNGAVHVMEKTLDGDSSPRSRPTSGPVPVPVSAAGATAEFLSWRVLAGSLAGLVAATRYLML